ncbi:MAG: TIGR02266 family protein [Deltaproteobacteria bacterium]|nr:MAG: TIGR02266 family protein [Deltaproteobacteria bacterium]
MSKGFDFLPEDAVRPPSNLPKSKMIMGIDLGTTYSCVAVVQEDFPKVIPSPRGTRTIPSIVAIDDKGRLLVGEQAQRQLITNPINTVYGAKRFIGRNFYSEEVDILAKHFSYRIVPIGEMEVGVELGRRKFSLPQVSALILNELRRNACEYFKENLYQAVISVPAYYSENQRQAVREAGRIAGLDVVRIINEPTAAALAYGLNRQYEKKVLVYDLGGGTFDATLLEIFENVFQVLATGGDTFLGGVDFDGRIVDFILSEYERTEGEILQCDSVVSQRLKDAAERAKIDLSSRSKTNIDLPYITISKGAFKDFRMELTRQQLETLTEDLVDRTLEVCVEVLDAAGCMPEDVENIILVGGQTRMPLVVEKISRFFAKPPTKGVHPDEVVACGAALMGNSLGTDTAVRLIDVLPMSIGGRQPDGSFKKIFEANTPLPAEREIGVATTSDGQEVIELFLYQGESERAVDNEFLGAFLISGFPPLPRGQVKLAVKFSLNQESILEVTARALENGRPMQVQAVNRAPVSIEDVSTQPVPAEQQPSGFSGLRQFIRRIRSTG